MFCILLANLRKQVKTPYNLLCVNERFSTVIIAFLFNEQCFLVY